MPTSDADNVPVRVRDYVDARFADHDKQHQAEHRALDAASAATDARLETMNEFRAALSEAQAHYVTRETFDARLDGARSRVDELAESAQRSAVLAGTAAGIIGVIGGFVLSHFLGR